MITQFSFAEASYNIIRSFSCQCLQMGVQLVVVRLHDLMRIEFNCLILSAEQNWMMKIEEKLA